MIVDYRHALTGEHREVEIDVKDYAAAPERIRFPFKDDPSGGHEASLDGPWKRLDWTRGGKVDGGVTAVPNCAVTRVKNGLPVSRSAPLKPLTGGETSMGGGAFKHKDGTITDRVGRRVIASKADIDRTVKTTGAEWD